MIASYTSPIDKSIIGTFATRSFIKNRTTRNKIVPVFLSSFELRVMYKNAINA